MLGGVEYCPPSMAAVTTPKNLKIWPVIPSRRVGRVRTPSAYISAIGSCTSLRAVQDSFQLHIVSGGDRAAVL